MTAPLLPTRPDRPRVLVVGYSAAALTRLKLETRPRAPRLVRRGRLWLSTPSPR